MTPATRHAALGLALLAALAGCQARLATTAAPTGAAPLRLTFTGTPAVQDGGYRLQAFTGYTADSIATMMVSLSANDTAATATYDLVATQVITYTTPFTLADLHPDRYYRVQLDAYGTGTLISVPASSTLDFDTLPDAQGTYTTQLTGTVSVQLADRPFTGTLDVVREVTPTHDGLRVELLEVGSATSYVQEDVPGTGVRTVTFGPISPSKTYLATTTLLLSGNPDGATVATASYAADAHASPSGQLDPLTF